MAQPSPAHRFRYSAWDGTQKGFELDARDVFGEITDDLLYHGDLNAALRRMLQEGFRDRDGRADRGPARPDGQAAGRRRDQLEDHDLGGVYDDIAGELRDVVDNERAALDDLLAEAMDSGDERRQELTRQVVDEHLTELDMLSPDLAGKVRELRAYDFTSAEAAQRFEELMDKLRQQLMQQPGQPDVGRHAERSRPTTCPARRTCSPSSTR